MTIPKKERDPHLEDKLRAEWPGILRWMIEGCLAWQRDGLSPPDAVTTATDEYLSAEDAFTSWLDECCSRDANAWTLSGVLFASWKAWAEAGNEYVGPRKQFFP